MGLDNTLNNTITAITGIEAGHYTDSVGGTGCTAILTKNGAIAGVSVRGGSPGTRETDLLSSERRIQQIHGIMLSGGSAFGLAVADGAMQFLTEQHIGYNIGSNIIPIIPAAILYDLNFKSHSIPTKFDGYSACQAASSDPLTLGSVGAGTGATLAKANGTSNAQKGGIGSSTVLLSSGIQVSAVVAVNAYGSIVDYRTGSNLVIPRNAGVNFSPLEPDTFVPITDESSLSNTTIGVIATDAAITKNEANYVSGIAHDGLAMCIRPCHTMRDGDTLFALGTGTNSTSFDIDEIAIAAVKATADAVISAVTVL